MTTRDDFTEEVKRVIAARVGYRCSNPDCGAATSGPQLNPSKALNLGVASHITAASPLGPRYNPSLSSEERKGVDNAIWLCQTCAKLIDNDEIRFPEVLLRRWKEEAEAKALALIGKTIADPLPLRPEVSNVPYPRNRFFTGRQQIIDCLRNNLVSNGTSTLTQPQAISGLGGIGKTQIAVEYAYRYRKEYRYILWAQADSYELLTSDYVAIASLLNLRDANIQDQDVTVKAVKYWLETNRDWLLILDNVEDIGTASEFIPSEVKGHLLITTRAHATGIVARSLSIDKMEPAEGALFLLRRAKIIAQDADLETASDRDRTKAEEISTEVDGLPLALDQAGAFIEEVPTNLTEYIELYKSQGSILRQQRGDVTVDHPESVAVTFALSFEKVASENKESADILCICAFLAPDAIPEEIFTEAASVLGKFLKSLPFDPTKLTETIKVAGKYSLLRRNPDAKTLSIHRLVQAVLRDRMDIAQQLTWATMAVAFVNFAFPKVAFSTTSKCERLLPHVFVSAENIKYWNFTFPGAIELLTHAGAYLSEHARHSEAESLCSYALKITEEAYPTIHSLRATAVNVLGMVYLAQGRYQDSEHLLQQALEISEKLFDVNDYRIALCLNNLGEVYRYQGKYKEAVSIYEQAIDILEKVDSPKDEHLVVVFNNLAEVYRIQGKYLESKAYYEKALAIAERALEPTHPQQSTCINNLANLYRIQGQYSLAEDLYRRAIEIFENAMGENHHGLATLLNNLGEILFQQGKYTEAETYLKRAEAIDEMVLGPHHPALAQELNNLALVYAAQDMDDKAEELYKQAITIWEQALGSEHPEVARGLKNLGVFYSERGNFKEVEQYFKRSLRIMEKSFGEEHFETAESLAALGGFYFLQERYTDAEALCKRALSTLKKTLGDNHPDVAKTSGLLAVIFFNQEKNAEAEPLFKKYIAYLENAPESKRSELAGTLECLAQVYYKQGEYNRAEDPAQKALILNKDIYGTNHEKVAENLSLLGILYYLQGKYEDAELTGLNSLAIYESLLKPSYPDIVRSLTNLATVYCTQGKYTKAEPLYKGIAAMWEQYLEPEDPVIINFILGYSLLLRKTNREVEANKVETLIKTRGLQSHNFPKIPEKKCSSEKRKIGRNDPCPCGSGKKFKKCCGI
jgi:tetratricopeptide (TPR) repeat protein